MIADIDNKPGQPGQMEPLIRTFMEHRAEGILYVGRFPSGSIAAGSAQPVPDGVG